MPDIFLYTALYGPVQLIWSYSSRCNSNTNSLDTLPLMLLYSYLLIRVIVSIPIHLQFPPTHSFSEIIAWWYHTYHTYLGLTKLFCLDLSWACICSRNHSHDLVSEIPEHITLERFGHVVANRIPCGTPYY